ncbi:MAG: threonine/serine exporter family protein [Nanoarchaeota archaeon]|nr:threonine/serine exporter family protein [Nanoarchaeota archaeon]MBU1005436.1 threonine/serine exporter family protein [Nanoarchaeota archaeon]
MKREKPQIYNKYPLWIVLVANIIMILGIIAGAYIMFRLHWITGIIYLVYVVFLEFTVYKEGCRDCYYYNSRCAFGKSYIAGIFFKKGDGKNFTKRKTSWKDLIPIMLGSIIPMIVGIALLISRGFHLLTLIAAIYPVVNWFVINPILYGQLSCKHCKQGSICCPALEFFSKGKTSKIK